MAAVRGLWEALGLGSLGLGSLGLPGPWPGLGLGGLGLGLGVSPGPGLGSQGCHRHGVLWSLRLFVFLGCCLFVCVFVFACLWVFFYCLNSMLWESGWDLFYRHIVRLIKLSFR